MALTERICGVCERPFAAARRDAKYCSDRCRQLAKRKPTREPAESVQRGLRDQILHELNRVKRAETFHGQLALELADDIAAKDATGVAALSKELRAVMVLALQGTSASGGGSGGGGRSKPPEDQVAKARAARDRKTRRASG